MPIFLFPYPYATITVIASEQISEEFNADSIFFINQKGKSS